MIGASIYGFVDYKKTSHQKEFTGMYESNEINTPETREVKKVTVTGKNDPVTQQVTEKNVPDNGMIKTAVINEGKTGKKYKPAKRRKLNYKQFSRAPLREELRVINLENNKEEVVKPRIENKEQ
jgi:hypothetical protein